MFRTQLQLFDTTSMEAEKSFETTSKEADKLFETRSTEAEIFLTQVWKLKS